MDQEQTASKRGLETTTSTDLSCNASVHSREDCSEPEPEVLHAIQALREEVLQLHEARMGKCKKQQVGQKMALPVQQQALHYAVQQQGPVICKPLAGSSIAGGSSCNPVSMPGGPCGSPRIQFAPGGSPVQGQRCTTIRRSTSPCHGSPVGSPFVVHVPASSGKATHPGQCVQGPGYG